MKFLTISLTLIKYIVIKNIVTQSKVQVSMIKKSPSTYMYKGSFLSWILDFNGSSIIDTGLI